MRIGLDIDNVIFDTDEEILKEMILEDKNKRNKQKINYNEKMFHFICQIFDELISTTSTNLKK